MSGGQRDADTGLTGRNRVNHPRRVNARALQLQVLELRKAGATFQAIADQLGRSKHGVCKAFAKAMIVQRAELFAAADEVRAIEIARLDHMLLKLWPRVNKGDDKAIDRAIKIGERRAELLGLDAPRKIAPVTPDGSDTYRPNDVSASQIAERVLELVERAKQRRAAGTPPTT